MVSIDFLEHIPALKDRTYLNTGTSGPTPQKAFQAQVDFLRRFTDEGYSTPSVATAYTQTILQARKTIANLLKCDATEVALTNSTSDGIGIVAQGLQWQQGDEIIISDLEHISGIAPWIALVKRHGVKVIRLQSHNGHITANDFSEAITPRTKLICVSHISWSTGTVLPLKQICHVARQNNVLTLVDGAQSAGHIPIDVQDIGCDFYTVSGQKWLLGPEGTGGLYINKNTLDRVAPTRIGWPSLENHDTDDDVLHYQPDARRFETGTVHAPAFASLTQSINMLASIGWDTIFSHALHLSSFARGLLAQLNGVTILSPEETASGLLTFTTPCHDPDECVRELWEKHRVIIRSIPPIGALRASFHIFNTEEDVQALVRGLVQCCGL